MTQRTMPIRIVAVLCVTALVAGGLGASAPDARAQTEPVPGGGFSAGPEDISRPGPTGGASVATTPQPVAPSAAADAAPAAGAAGTAPEPAASGEGSPELGAVGPAPSDGAAAERCTATPGERPKRDTHPASTGRPDEARRSGVVNSARRARSAASGCRKAPTKSDKRKPRKPKPARDRASDESMRDAGGVPTAGSASSFAWPGPLPFGVPNFFIDRFRIPPFLLPIYQAAGIQYGIPWEILAAINEIETDYGRNLNVSSAGALGWMQFMPATWASYGVDANSDGRRDPFNPVDAIFAAARYLKAAGAGKDLRKGLFAYNHADWYVDSVLMRARVIGGLPAQLIGALGGLSQGRFPLPAGARYAGDSSERDVKRRVTAGTSPAIPVESDGARRHIDIYAREGSPVTAVQDGTIVATGRTKRLGSYVRLRDAYGNSYTYGHLKSVARRVPVPRRRTRSRGSSARKSAVVRRSLVAGRRVTAGTVLGSIGRTSRAQPHVSFEIRPAGRGAPRIDPKPILDGWKLLRSTAIYGARGRSGLIGPNARSASIGQIMLMSKETLIRRVLDNPRIETYSCGRRDIEAGIVDRRVLAALEFLAGSGLNPTISSLTCGHGHYTSSGNVSAHSSGNAVDIAGINGIPILSHQGEGSITDITIRRLMTLQGTAKPDQIISLMKYAGADNTLAMGDHNDHIHVGFGPPLEPGSKGARQLEGFLKPAQWSRLIDRLGRIDNPSVRVKPSR